MRTETDYAISLQRCIESHCRDKVIREPLSDEAPHHAKMLNLYRANLVDENEAMKNALIEANETIRQLYEICPQCEGSVEEWLGQVLPFANVERMHK